MTATLRGEPMTQFTDKELPGAPLPADWVLDPEAPTLQAWELRDGAYVEVAAVTGPETFLAQVPFVVDLTPEELATL